MQAQVARKMGDSARAFKTCAWPVVSPWLGGGELIPVETVTDETMRRHLDMLAGIDAWFVSHAVHGMSGVASRVQWIKKGAKPYNTFSIRNTKVNGYETEYAKYLRAIKSDGRLLYPAYAVQTYCSAPPGQEQLLSVGIARTADVIQIIADGADQEDWFVRTNPQDGTTFFAVEWGHMRALGYKVKWWSAQSSITDISE